MKQYQQLIALFSEHLLKYKAELHVKTPAELYTPAGYIISLGGKRLRPLLALLACDLLDKDPQQALNSALAVELFHNFSLIHDDILDEAPLRRGKATVHEKWNSKIAILSGDAMMVKAFQVLQKHEPKQAQELSNLFIQTALEVCEGQQLDMNFETAAKVSAEEYLHMITFKTAVLLGCSLQMGAINAAADETQQKLLYHFGKELGIAFQLLDDLLDAFAEDPAKFGKQIGGDILSNKKTYLLIKSLELANEKQKEEITQILELSEKTAAVKVNKMLHIFNELNIRQFCQAEADKHTRAAIDYLNLVKADETKKSQLREFALDLLNRQV